MFESHFWLLYPRRKQTPVIEGKKKCREKLEKMVAAGEVTWETVKEGTLKYAVCDRVKDGYVKMPITFINGECWDDEYDLVLSPQEAAWATLPKDCTLVQWRARFGVANEWNRKWQINNWNSDNGPEPGQPGCQVPQEILTEYGWIREVG